MAGLALGAFGFWYLAFENIAGAATSFGLCFFSFFYANLSRFKRFKGFGLEAELWEDKQKEAAELIERLRSIVHLYSHEILIGKVTAGRLGNGTRWRDIWPLFERVKNRHSELGQSIDFSETKRLMDTYFLFDLIVDVHNRVVRIFTEQINEIRKKLSLEFGSPVSDVDGYTKKMAQLNSLLPKFGEPFEVAKSRTLATDSLAACERFVKDFKTHYDCDVILPPNDIALLKKLSLLESAKDLTITRELIELADEPKK